MLAYRDDAMYTPPPLPRWRLILNSILGLAFWILAFFLRQKTSSFLPLTLDTLGQIVLTDITRQKSARALAQLQRKTAHADAEHKAAAGRNNAAGVPYLVSIVGYREEEALFRRCLQSYRTTCTGATTLLVGIDGDKPEDLEMVAAVRSVYPQAVVLGLPEPLGEMAQRLAELKAFGGHFMPSESAHERLEVFHALPEDVKKDAEEWAMEEVVKAAGEILSEGGVLREGKGDGMQRANWVSGSNGLPTRPMRSLQDIRTGEDPLSVVYADLPRKENPKPPTQIVNDDRHLSTCLMLANYRITFNTYVLTLTDTPTTSMALLLQQLRWSRATYIETLQYPLVYAIRGPVALICAVRRVYGPLAMAVFTARYAWSGSVPFAFSPLDFALRLALCAGYNLLFFRRHLRGAVRHWSLLVASQLFYQVPLPGIAVWSCVTMLQGSWGTSMRGVGEKRRARHPGWENLGAVLALSAWLGVVGAAVGRWVAATWFQGMEGVCARAAWMAVAVWMSWFFLRKQKV
ncbi:hypothetical protein SLS56_002530 [Neofusicoccum ribis]|uniref:Glycosyltransferase family 2 protein n=1 Tax=Neofusicoccum ribis TaxID=45134 RepID=A0ABR3T325_9PEZI